MATYNYSYMDSEFRLPTADETRAVAINLGTYTDVADIDSWQQCIYRANQEYIIRGLRQLSGLSLSEVLVEYGNNWSTYVEEGELWLEYVPIEQPETHKFLADVVNRVSEYPVLDEERWSELESELIYKRFRNVIEDELDTLGADPDTADAIASAIWEPWSELGGGEASSSEGSFDYYADHIREAVRLWVIDGIREIDFVD